MDSSLLIAITVLILAPAVAITIMLLVRRRAPDGGYFNDGDRASGVFGVLATGFSVLLGLIVVLAYSSYDQSRGGAQVEAQLVTQQYQTAQFMPPADGPELAAELICYGRYVVYREWPLMEEGAVVDAVNPWGLAMFLTFSSIEPESASEQAAYSRWLEQTSEREVARIDRVQGAAGIIPNSLWAVLLLSSSVIFVYMLFFADSGEHPIVQGLLMGAVIIVITATLFLIRFLESPYQAGLATLQPDSMERSLAVIAEVEDVAPHAPLPCNESGDRIES